MSRQNLALWALIILPLLVSVVANLVKAGPIGVACSLGAAAFAAFGAVVSDVSSAVLRERAAEVTATDEKELRRVAMADDLFDTAPSSPSARSVPLPSAVASPLRGLREDELVALGADARGCAAT
ncbi:hypothetical protein Acsp04_51060 [Actinomadura sp. NBRC 104425]|uniref:hypothetical protein n=1 Tax=Actinomadura sp. NBRC 104425 TaxID=3032204 RepID=UPI0024A5B411|nr:hypothetical protein [Actinomadura sp. NBRC 104425]GLZ14871.1 hypothetical protein Acsp04_51060 [Actinomadura sp. NBRC 104425]